MPSLSLSLYIYIYIYIYIHIFIYKSNIYISRIYIYKWDNVVLNYLKEKECCNLFKFTPKQIIFA